jgi:hypothetical protein
MKRIAVGLAGVLVVGGVFIHLNWADGVGYALCEFLMGDTAYSPGYTERAYMGIKVGFTVEEVQKRLGDPLGVTRSEGCDYYGYSTWGIPEMDGNGPAFNYSYRLLIISNDVVIGKWHKYYWD